MKLYIPKFKIMAQEKVKVTMSDGTYRIIPVDNIDNVRRVMGYNIQSIENYSTTKTIISKEKNVKILPVDSEHSAIFQCLASRSFHNAKKPIAKERGVFLNQFLSP